MIDFGFFKKRIKKIKDTKSVAFERNVANWYQIVFYSFMGIFLLSAVSNFGLIILVSDLTSSVKEGSTAENIIWGTMSVMPFILTGVFVFTILDKVIILHIMVMEKINKQIMKVWHWLDMQWFKKYRKSSPLTETTFKIHEKSSKIGRKLSSRQKLVIKIALIVVLIAIQIWWRGPVLMDSFENLQDATPEISDNQMDQDNSEIVERHNERPEIIINVGG